MHYMEYDFAIIGGGFSGAAVAVQLLRQSSPGTSIVLFDRSPAPGRGLAYGTNCSQHLLNVPVSDMSALPDDPNHFLRWARQNVRTTLTGSEFVARRAYGQYASDLLTSEILARRGRHFALETSDVLSLEPGELSVRITHRYGAAVARKVILATGNQPPSDPLPFANVSSERYVGYAWEPSALEGLPQNSSVLILGSGLTSIDVVLALREKGNLGSVHLLSRHGLLPHMYRRESPWDRKWTDSLPRTARGLLRAVRDQVQLAAARNIDWRAVVDSMRPSIPTAWASLSIKEKRRFLRHLRCYWDVHRHRVAPEIYFLLQELMLQARVTVHAGRILSYRESGNHVQVQIRERRTGLTSFIAVDRIINCTGSETDCRKLDDVLIRDLLYRGLARPDPLSLGLDTSQDGALIDAQGAPSNMLFAIGPLVKGILWECTAVPEIRHRAQALAQKLISINHEKRTINSRRIRCEARATQSVTGFGD